MKMKRMKMMMRTAAGLVGVLGLLVTAPLTAQTPAGQRGKAPGKPTGKHVMFAPDDLKWGPAPESLPAGAQAAVLDGDPTKPGLFTIRLRFPGGFSVPPHSHPTDEHVTILSGALMAGMGDKIDESAMQTLKAGSYVKMPARMNHYVRAQGETIIQVVATGPFQVRYVNPGDDPRKKPAK